MKLYSNNNKSHELSYLWDSCCRSPPYNARRGAANASIIFWLLEAKDVYIQLLPWKIHKLMNIKLWKMNMLPTRPPNKLIIKIHNMTTLWKIKHHDIFEITSAEVGNLVYIILMIITSSPWYTHHLKFNRPHCMLHLLHSKKQTEST